MKKREGFTYKYFVDNIFISYFILFSVIDGIEVRRRPTVTT